MALKANVLNVCNIGSAAPPVGDSGLGVSVSCVVSVDTFLFDSCKVSTKTKAESLAAADSEVSCHL